MPQDAAQQPTGYRDYYKGAEDVSDEPRDDEQNPTGDHPTGLREVLGGELPLPHRRCHDPQRALARTLDEKYSGNDADEEQQESPSRTDLVTHPDDSHDLQNRQRKQRKPEDSEQR